MTPKSKDIDDPETYAMRQSMADQIVPMAREEGWWFIAMAYHDGTQRLWSMKKPTSRAAKVHLDEQLLLLRKAARHGPWAAILDTKNYRPARWARWFLGRG